MRREPVSAPMRRVLVVIAVILVVVIAGIIQSYLAWAATFDRWSAATRAEVVATRCSGLQAVFAAERPLMLRYLAQPLRRWPQYARCARNSPGRRD